MKYKNLFLGITFIIFIAGSILTIRFFLNQNLSWLSLSTVGATIISAVVFISGLNDSWSLMSKVIGERNAEDERIPKAAEQQLKVKGGKNQLTQKQTVSNGPLHNSSQTLEVEGNSNSANQVQSTKH